MGRFSLHAFFLSYTLHASTALSKHGDFMAMALLQVMDL